MKVDLFHLLNNNRISFSMSELRELRILAKVIHIKFAD